MGQDVDGISWAKDVQDSKLEHAAEGSRGDGEDDAGDNAESDCSGIPDSDPAYWAQQPGAETRSGNDDDAQPEAGKGGESDHGDGAGGGVQGDVGTDRGDGPPLSIQLSSEVTDQSVRL